MQELYTEQIPCPVCGCRNFIPLLEKESARGNLYSIVRCGRCALVQVNPPPAPDILTECYNGEYFTRRTDRGYDDYYSASLKRQILTTCEMNLRDLDFFPWEESLLSPTELSMEDQRPAEHQPAALDVGCAAGYFVEYLQKRGWHARGIELSAAVARFGIEHLDLDIIIDDFLSCDSLRPASFDLITLWASLEHMPRPREVLERAAELLKPGGRMILTTCRYGLLAWITGREWRYLNVPEHLTYFTLTGLRRLAEETGLVTANSITYGSGFTARRDAGPLYRTAKRLADRLVKRFNQGDMMALLLIKEQIR